MNGSTAMTIVAAIMVVAGIITFVTGRYGNSVPPFEYRLLGYDARLASAAQICAGVLIYWFSATENPWVQYFFCLMLSKAHNCGFGG